MPAWTPPKITKPIDARAYAVLRAMIETGALVARTYEKALAEGCTDNCLPHTTPSVTLMATLLYEYVPATLLPLAPGLDDSDRTSVVTFQLGRDALLAALDQAAGPKVLGLITAIPGAEDAPAHGPQWWAAALKTGPLKNLGKQLWRHKQVSRTVSQYAGETDVFLESPLIEAAAAILAALDKRPDALARCDAAADRLYKMGLWSFLDHTIYINKTPAHRLEFWEYGQPVAGLTFHKSAKQIVKDLYESWYGAALLPGSSAYQWYKIWDEGPSLPDFPKLPDIPGAIGRMVTTVAVIAGVTLAGVLLFKYTTRSSNTVYVTSGR